MSREIALDTETTGLDPYAGHRIVEIGCVEMVNHIKTGNHFHVYLNPERDMPMEAEQVHGLSHAFLQDKPLFKEIAASLLEFIEDSPLVIHNAAFDLKFLNAELEAISRPILPMERGLDTVMMARRLFPGQPASLDALCKRFNIDLSARSKHGALFDAELLADVYLELRGGRQERLALQPELTASSTELTISQTEIHFPLREFLPTADEIRAHRQFLEALGKPLWLAEA